MKPHNSRKIAIPFILEDVSNFHDTDHISVPFHAMNNLSRFREIDILFYE